MTDAETIDFRDRPFNLSVLWPGNDGAVAAGDGNDLDESRDREQCGREFLIENDAPRPVPQ